MGEAITTRDSYPRRRAGVPLLGRARVFRPGIMQDGRVLEVPDRLRYSDFEMGATVTVVEFPGDPQLVAWENERHPRAPARSRRGPGLRVPAPEPQTVSNRRRAELTAEMAGLDLVPEARLEIFEALG